MASVASLHIQACYGHICTNGMEEASGDVHKIQVLTPEQLGALNQAKARLSLSAAVLYYRVMIRMDNGHYLREHPDVTKVMRALVRGIIRDRPKNVSTYAYRFFARPTDAIRKDLDANE